MFQDFGEDHGSNVESKREDLEKVELMAVRKGHELVKLLPDGHVEMGILEIQRGPPDCFHDELLESVVVGHGEMRSLDEFVQAREIYDKARSSRGLGDAEEVCREAGL